MCLPLSIKSHGATLQAWLLLVDNASAYFTFLESMWTHDGEEDGDNVGSHSMSVGIKLTGALIFNGKLLSGL